MIKLNMLLKNELVKLDINAFNMENNILTLEIDVGDYDLIGKTISAVFESKLETQPLVVEDGIIKLPITNDLVDFGWNYIQLNFRWENKLEQSPKLVWYVDKSLVSEGIKEESVDLLNHLINLVKETQVEVDLALTQANSVVDSANNVRMELDESVLEATLSKGGLDNTIVDANNINNILSNPINGSIVVGNNVNSGLVENIENANTLKTEIEQAILDNQIVKKSEFQTLETNVDELSGIRIHKGIVPSNNSIFWLDIN